MRGKRYVEELGRPHGLLAVGRSKVGYTIIEARKGKPGHRVKSEPKWTEGTAEQAGEGVLSKGKPTGYRWGVLSGIVLGGGESHYLGKDLTEARSPQRKLMPDR